MSDSSYMFWRRVAVGLAVAVLAAVVYLSDVLTPFFIAFGLAYAFNPVVGYLEKKRLSRSQGAALVTFLLLLFAALLITSIVPVLIRDGAQFFSDLPEYLSRALDRVTRLGDRVGIDVPERASIIERIQQQIRKTGPAVFGSVAAVTTRVFAGAGAVVFSILELLIIPLFLFFLLRDFSTYQKKFLQLFPRRHQGAVAERLEKIDRVCAGFIRGQLSVALILAGIFAIGLPIIGVKYGLVIGILSGLLNMIPYVGQLTGACLSILMVLVDFPGWGPLIAVPIFFVVTNFIEGHFLTPKIVGNKVGLSPLQAILALLIGGSLAGITGMILALPVVGSIKVLLADLLHHYRQSPFYQHGKRE